MHLTIVNWIVARGEALWVIETLESNAFEELERRGEAFFECVLRFPTGG